MNAWKTFLHSGAKLLINENIVPVTLTTIFKLFIDLISFQNQAYKGERKYVSHKRFQIQNIQSYTKHID
jgi:hypothetical protein